MKMKPVFIAFSTQKGGVGKTTFTVLAASYLHYVCGDTMSLSWIATTRSSASTR